MPVNVSTLGIKVTSDGIKEASTSLGGLTTSARNAEKSTSALVQAMEKLEKASKTATGQVDVFNQKLHSQMTVMATLNSSTAASAAATAQLAAAMNVLSHSVVNIVTHTNQARISQQGHNQAMREAHGLARGLAGSLGVLWVTYGSLGGMAAGIAIGASLKQVVVQGIQLEHTLEAIRVKGEESVASINKIRDAVLELGKGIYSVKQVAEAFEVLILAGLNAEQALSSVGAALNLATIGGVGIEKAASTLVSVGTAVGYTAENFGRVADVISKTAALSMSSVETLSEAFKQASSVSLLYGVSLEDIATQLGLLSNLGIKGSAAGTAVKNMYKELNSEASKVVDTLKAIGVQEQDIKLPTGQFRDYITVVEAIDAGLNKLSGNERKHAEERITNERGLRLHTAAMEAHRTKIIDTALSAEMGFTVYTTKLRKFQEDVTESYAFAAIGAAQMALSTKNQFISVGNTLTSVFATSFKTIEPNLQLFAQTLKDIFSSSEFQTFITGSIKLLVGFAQKVMDAYVAVGTFIVKLKDLVMQIPVTGEVLRAVGKLWGWYYDQVAGGDKAAEQARKNSDSFLESLKKEEKKLEDTIKKMKEKKSLFEATNELARNEALTKNIQDEDAALRPKRLAKIAADEALANLQGVSLIRTHAAVEADRLKLTKAQAEAQKDLNAALEIRNKNIKAAEDTMKNLAAHSKTITQLDKENTKKADVFGEGRLPTKEKGAAAIANDIYLRDMKEFDNQVKASKRELQRFEDAANAQFKAGEMGKLKVIQEVANKSIEEYTKQEASLQAKMARAKSAPESENRRADIERIEGELEAVRERIANVGIKAAQDRAVELARLEEDSKAHRVKSLEAEGKYVEAAQLKYSQDYSRAFKRIEADFEQAQIKLAVGLITGADISETVTELGILGNALKTLKSEQTDFMAVAKLKEDTKALGAEMAGFKTAMDTVFDSAKADGGLASALDAAGAAQAIQEKYMPAVAKLVESLKVLKDANPANADMARAYEEAARALQTISETGVKSAEVIGNAWKNMGDDIANSLNKAFGSVGNSLGGAVQAYTNYNAKRMQQDAQYVVDHKKAVEKATSGDATAIKELQKLETTYRKKSERDEVDMYANMAGAAKGMFSEKTAAYKILDGIEKAMHMWKMASQAAEMLGNMQVAQSAVTAGAMEAEADMLAGTASAMAAVANQGQGDPYSAFFRIAAMAAIMAGLGFAVGGGGGGSGGDTSAAKQALAGTGTITGDETAKSESLAHSIELLEKNSAIENEYSNKMLSALLAIRDNLGGIAAMVSTTSGLRATAIDQKEAGVGSSPGIFGIGATTTSIIDSGIHVEKGQTVGGVRGGNFKAQGFTDIEHTDSGFFGLFSSEEVNRKFKKLDADLLTSFGKTIGLLADSLANVGEVLGVSTQDIINTLSEFPIELGDISFKGLTGKEVQDQLQAIFGSIGDGMAKTVFPMLAPFNKVGEGMYETSIRVATGIEKATNSLSFLGLQAIKYTDIINKQGDVELEIIRQSIVNMEMIEGKSHNVHTEAFTTKEKRVTGQKFVGQTQEQANFNQMMNALNGTTLDETVGSLVDIIETFDLLHPATDRMVGDMTGIGEIMQSFNGTAEDAITLYITLNDLRSTMRAFGNTAADVTLEMIKGAGGLDRLKEGTESYYENFFTDTEKAVASGKKLSETFKGMTNATDVIWPKSIEGFRQMVEGIDRGTEAGQRFHGQMMAAAPEFAAYMEQIVSFGEKAGISASNMATSIADGLLGKINEADLGGEMSNVVVGGVYNALANGVSEFITQLVMDSIVNPIMESIILGGNVTAAVNRALTEENINAIIAGAEAAANALAQIFNNEDFKKAMDKLKATMQGIANVIAPSTVNPVFTPYVPPEKETSTGGSTTTQEAAYKARTLEIELLKLQGRAQEALTMQREDELAVLKDANDKVLKEQIYKLQDIQKLRELGTQLMQAEGYAYEATQRQRQDALKLMTAEQQIIQKQINAAQDRIKSEDLMMQILKLSGDEEGELAAKRAKELRALSEGDRVLQLHIYKLQDQAKAATTSVDAMKKIINQLDQLASFAESLDSTIMSIRKETAGFDMSGYFSEKLKNTKAEFEAVLGGSSLEEKLKKANALQETIMEQYSFEKSELEKKVQKEEEAYNKGIQAQNEAINAANQLSDAFRNIGEFAKSMLVGPNSPLSLRQKVLESTRQFQDLLGKTRGGDVEAAGKLTGASTTNLEAIKANSKTALEFNRAFMRQQVELAKVGDMAQVKLEQVVGNGFKVSAGLQIEMNTLQNSTIEKLEEIAEQADNWSKELMDQLAAEAQVFAAIGLTNAMIAQNTANLDTRIATAIAAALGTSSTDITNQGRNFGTNVDMNKWLAQMTGYMGDFGGGGFIDYITSKGIDLQQLEELYRVANPITQGGGGVTGGMGGGLPSFDVGTNYVTEDTVAEIHKGERIMPAADNARLEALVRSGSAARDNEEAVKELREVKALLASMGVSISKTEYNTCEGAKFGKRTSDVMENAFRDGSTLQVTTRGEA